MAEKRLKLQGAQTDLDLQKLRDQARVRMSRHRQKRKLEATARMEKIEREKQVYRVNRTPPLAPVKRARSRVKPAPAPAPVKIGRNEPCPCGSGKKHKRCCGAVGGQPSARNG